MECTNNTWLVNALIGQLNASQVKKGKEIVRHFSISILVWFEDLQKFVWTRAADLTGVNFFVLNSDIICCSIIPANRIENTTFIKFVRGLKKYARKHFHGNWSQFPAKQHKTDRLYAYSR